jgi:hypothetical protein
MHRTSAFVLATFALPLVLAACSKQPQLDVSTAATPAAAPAAAAAPLPGEVPAAPAHEPVAQAPAQAAPGSAPPLAPGATLPPGHPAMDAPTQMAPPIAPGAQLPPNHPPMGGAPGMGGQSATQAMAGMVRPGGEGEQAVAWAAPKSWVSEPPANPMRKAQYKVPGAGGDAECVVFYFGPGQGGDPQSNAERWASQFANADGTPATSAMKTRVASVNGMKVTYVETKGTYLAGSMSGTEVAKKPNYALLGAIVEGPDANWFVKLTGPEATVSAQKAAFESMIGSMKKGA